MVIKSSVSGKSVFRQAAVFVLTAVLGLVLAFPSSGQKQTAPKRIQSTDSELRLKGWAAHLEMEAASPFKELKWRHIGPTNISGRATDVAVVAPKGKNYTIYAAAASGGVWKTVNEGTTWEPVFDRAASTSIGDIALAPSNPDIVWVGTGEANIFRSSQAGCGIYKSEDAGKTWRHMGLSGTYTIARIIVHPENPDIVYVAASGHEWTDNAERGVFMTADGGKTWKNIFFLDSRTGAVDLVMDPADPATLYAASWQRIRFKWNDPRVMPGYDRSAVYKTTDGGLNWKLAVDGLPEARFRGRIGLDVCRAHPETLYALVDNYEFAREPTEEEALDSYGRPSSGIIKGATVYRSDDRGGTWRLVAPTTSMMKAYLERHSGTYGWVFGQIRVDPNDPETVYILGVPLSVSNDGGKSFRMLRGMHGDHHGLWIDPENSDYIVNANDGGVVVSYDRGVSWRQFTDNLPVCQFFNIAYDMADPFRVYGSMQDHGSFRAAVDLSRGRDAVPAVPFEWAPGGEGCSHAVDPLDPDTVYSAGFYGRITRTDMRLPRGRGTKSLLPPPFPGEAPLRGQWVAPIILSPHHNETVFNGMQYLYRSTNRGDVLERISPDLTYNTPSEMGDIPYHTLTAISESPRRAGLIYVGTDDGKVHVTRDFGRTWREIMAGLPYQKWVSRIVASAFDLGTVYMTQNGKRDDDFTPYVWKSTDFGRTWTSIAGNIPLGPVNVIREDPVDRNILYVGTDGGVYATKDGGKTWGVLGSGLPMVYVHDLIIHPRDNIVVIATHGRGMWALDANRVNNKDRRPRRFRED
ncbi:MAG: hypothetical protein JW747_06605 [Candidatus Aminicenantes bacterium]|nr:hypothetical protein [Candidatus Aminicenantes bacterium]